MELVTVARCRQGLDANLIRGFLESEQIPTVLANEYVVGVNWLYSDAIGGVEVQVETSDAESAVCLLRNRRADSLDDSGADIETESACAECGSTKLSPPHGSFFKALWSALVLSVSIVAIPLLIVALPLVVLPRRRRCLECGQWSQIRSPQA